MLIPVTVLLCSGAIVLLYRFFNTRRGARALWRSSVAIGFSVGITRAVLACVGWYGVEHAGGPLQIPAFALAMLAWPEAIVFGRHRGPVPLSFYPYTCSITRRDIDADDQWSGSCGTGYTR